MSQLWHRCFRLILLLAVLSHASYSIAAEARRYSGHGSPARNNSNAKQVECPTALFDQVLTRDKKNGWLGTAMFLDQLGNEHKQGSTVHDNCSASKVISAINSPRELDSVLRSIPDLNLGSAVGEGHLQSCLSSYQGENELPQKDAQSAIADYVYLMNRLKLGAKANMEGVAGIDRLLGGEFLQGYPTHHNSSIPKSGDLLAELKSSPACRALAPASEMQKMTEQTQYALKSLVELRKRREKNLQRKGRANGTIVPINAELDAKLNKSISAIENAFPWLISPAFEDIVDSKHPFKAVVTGKAKRNGSAPTKKVADTTVDKWTDEAVQSRLIQHFKDSRAAMISQSQSLQAASDCIHSNKKGCLRDHLEAIATTPEINVSKMMELTVADRSLSAEQADKLGSAYIELSGGACRQTFRELKRDTAEIANSTLVNVALTAATFGASAYAMAAIKGAQAVAAAGGRTLSIYQASSKIPNVAKAAFVTSIGIDASWVGPSAKDALEQCAKDVSLKAKRTSSAAPQDPNKISCTENDGLDLAIARESRNCILSASLAAVDALPLLPPLAHSFASLRKTSSVIEGAADASPGRSTVQSEELAETFGSESQKPRSDRAPAREVLSSRRPASSDAADLSGLDSQESWKNLIANQNIGSKEDVAKLATDIDNLPPSERDQAIAQLLENYADLEKSARGAAPTVVPPRRAASQILNKLLDNGSEASQASSADEALEIYSKNFARTQSYLPQGQGYGEYTAEQVVEFNRELQKLLKEKDFPLDEGESVILGGSVPAGLGRSGHSDLDLYTDDIGDLIPLQNDINELSRRVFGETAEGRPRFEFDGQPAPSTVADTFIGGNGIQLESTAQGVRLRAAPSNLGGNPAQRGPEAEFDIPEHGSFSSGTLQSRRSSSQSPSSESSPVRNRSVRDTSAETQVRDQLDNVFAEQIRATSTENQQVLTEFLRNQDWKNAIPAHQRDQVARGLESFFNSGGHLSYLDEVEDIGRFGISTQGPRKGLPYIALDKNLFRPGQEQRLAETLLHELDHFHRIERRSRQIQQSSPGSSIEQARRTAMQRQSESSVLEIERSAVGREFDLGGFQSQSTEALERSISPAANQLARTISSARRAGGQNLRLNNQQRRDLRESLDEMATQLENRRGWTGSNQVNRTELETIFDDFTGPVFDEVRLSGPLENQLREEMLSYLARRLRVTPSTGRVLADGSTTSRPALNFDEEINELALSNQSTSFLRHDSSQNSLERAQADSVWEQVQGRVRRMFGNAETGSNPATATNEGLSSRRIGNTPSDFDNRSSAILSTLPGAQRLNPQVFSQLSAADQRSLLTHLEDFQSGGGQLRFRTNMNESGAFHIDTATDAPIIELDESLLRNPEALQATLRHELSHFRYNEFRSQNLLRDNPGTTLGQARRQSLTEINSTTEGLRDFEAQAIGAQMPQMRTRLQTLQERTQEIRHSLDEDPGNVNLTQELDRAAFEENAWRRFAQHSVLYPEQVSTRRLLQEAAAQPRIAGTSLTPSQRQQLEQDIRQIGNSLREDPLFQAAGSTRSNRTRMELQFEELYTTPLRSRLTSEGVSPERTEELIEELNTLFRAQFDPPR